MCDTILASPVAALGGAMLFGKNSDRHSNEAQAVECFPRASHAPDAQLRCTYITIPQVRHTHAVLLCRPFWIWGAEMGANEHGVVIGNEGLRARSPSPESNALTGMDLLRLALERSRSAREAVEVITTLLELYGQGGNCGHHVAAYYNNGFMIADSSEAFVLETVERQWVLERVRSVRAISNAYSIAEDAHSCSAGLEPVLRDWGWNAHGDEKPNYAQLINDPTTEHIAHPGVRRACSTSLMRARESRLTVADMMSILRDHGTGERYSPEWKDDCTTRRTLCMHAGGKDRPVQTTGSMASQLLGHYAVHWVTATTAPCISIFKPVLLDAALPEHGPRPAGRFDDRTLWWRHEQFHRQALLADYAQLLDEIRAERDALEAQFRTHVEEVASAGGAADRAHVVEKCWQEALAMENAWIERFPLTSTTGDAAYADAWRFRNEQAGLVA